MAVRRWHINPKTGDVGRCSAVAGQCPFGSLGVHFYDENEAYGAASSTLSNFHNWTVNSAVPQEEGWYTVHVFDPKTEKRSIYRGLGLAKPGHRLVVENGHVYEKTTKLDLPWRGVAGRFVRPGLDYDDLTFTFALKREGGRIEMTEGLPSFEIEWKS